MPESSQSIPVARDGSTPVLPGAERHLRKRVPGKPAAGPNMDRALPVITRWTRYLSSPIDGASLAMFRIFFGLLMLVEVLRYLGFGWVKSVYVEPEFLFRFVPFIDRWPGNGMYLHFAALGVLALMVMAGLWYRAATGLFCVGFTYVFLLEKAQYLNHLYLVCLISFLLFLIPAHRCWSVDAWRRRGRWDGVVPRWALLTLQFQVALVYFYAGIAKLNVDWLQGEPQRSWLSAKGDFPWLGPYLTQEWCVTLVTVGGLSIDLVIGFLLFWRRTFWIAALLAFGFHFGNAYLFNIGIFPFLMMATVPLFARPDWPREYAAEIRRHYRLFSERMRRLRLRVERWIAPTKRKRSGDWNLRSDMTVLAILHVYMVIQLLMPWRHLLYPGNVHWTEEGHRFSWHMMLRQKKVDLAMYLTDPRTNRRGILDLDRMLTERQRRKMPSRPDMLHQFAVYAADRYEAQHGVRPAVHVYARASLNGRPAQLLIDPNVDLAAQPRTLRPKEWIVPLEE